MSNPVCADCGCETVPAESDQMKWHECPRCEPLAGDDHNEWMKSDSQRAAEELMRAAGQTILDAPGEPSEEDRLLRAKLILEETLETIEALGVGLRDFTGCIMSIDDFDFDVLPSKFNLIEAIDGCCDLNVVVAGTLSAMGVPDEPVQTEVENSNRSKLLDDGTLPPHPEVEGKFGKGPNYHAPNIQRVLDSIFEQKIGGKA